MIARSWDGLTPAAKAEEYTDYVRKTGVTELAATDGNLGVYLLRRREGDQERFRVLSLWDSMDGIRRFAGDDVEKARYFPEDARFLLALAEDGDFVAHAAVAQVGNAHAGFQLVRVFHAGEITALRFRHHAVDRSEFGQLRVGHR